MSCAGAAAATATTLFFQKFNKGRGVFSPLFPFDRGLCALLCFNTTPIHFESLSLGAGEEAAAFVLLMDGGGAALQLLLSTI